MGGVFTKIGNFFKKCWEGIKKFIKTTVNLIIKGIAKLCTLVYENNILNIRTSGRGRDLYAWALAVQEEMKNNGIKPTEEFSHVIEDLKDNNQNKELTYKIESKDIKEIIHTEEENEKLKEINNKYNLDLNFKTEIIEISHYKNFDDEMLTKFITINFEKIKSLNLSYNNISTIDPLKGFNNSFFLEKLNLSYNNLTTIDDMSECDFQYLEDLDISNNNIEYIDSLKDSKFENLKTLNITNNKLNPNQDRIINKLIKRDVKVIN